MSLEPGLRAPFGRSHLDQAASELREYLCDTTPPMLVSESVDALLHQPDLAAHTIYQWAGHQQASGMAGVPLSQLFYHALKKIQWLEELSLVEDEASHRRRLEATAGQLRHLCPPVEQADFDGRLRFLYEESMSSEPRIDLLHSGQAAAGPARAAGTTAPPGAGGGVPSTEAPVPSPPAFLPPAPAPEPDAPAPASRGPVLNWDPAARRLTLCDPRSGRPLLLPGPAGPPAASAMADDDLDPSLRRLAHLVHRLELATEGAGRVHDVALSSEMMLAATEIARSQQELLSYLGSFEKAGLDGVPVNRIFKSLTDRLPDWYLAGTDLMQAAPIRAVHRVLGFDDNRRNAGDHMKQLLTTAVEHFNEGSLGRAATVLSLAEALFEHGGLEEFQKDRLRSVAQRELDRSQLREYSNDNQRHDYLRRFLSFFDAFSPETLIDQLMHEQDRKQRHLILSILRIHGEEARAAVSKLLVEAVAVAASAGAQEAEVRWPWYVRRNLVYLLRHISVEELDDGEVEAVIYCSELFQPSQLVREALLYLGKVATPRAAATLIERLGVLVGLMGERGRSPQELADLSSLVFLVLGQLLQQVVPEARRAALVYMLAEGAWQDEYGKLLVNLGTSNLADDRAALDLVLAAIRARLPSKGLMNKLGLFKNDQEETLIALLHSLRSTPASEVERVLGDVIESGVGERAVELARSVRSGLEELGRERNGEESTTLAGDLDVFGLPCLLQTLEQNRSSGLVQIRCKSDTRSASLRLFEGQLAECHLQELHGEEAFYTLIQRPFPSRFSFASDGEEPAAPAHQPRGLTSLLLEGSRRYDELERLRFTVPDEVRLELTGQKPTLPKDDPDRDLARDIWQVLQRGASAVLCEEQLKVEPYRIRRLLGHWVLRGALSVARAA